LGELEPRICNPLPSVGVYHVLKARNWVSAAGEFTLTYCRGAEGTVSLAEASGFLLKYFSLKPPFDEQKIIEYARTKLP